MVVNFKLNTRLEILQNDDVYKSIIQDSNNDYIAISIPVREGVYMTPSEGERIEALYHDDINVYKFEASVLGRKSENNIRQILISIPENMIKIQRRQFVRINLTYYIQYARLEKESETNRVKLASDEQVSHNGIMLDLSGGGCKIKTKQPLRAKDWIVINLPIEDEFVNVIGEIVRVEKTEDKKFMCGISFVGIDEKSRDKIIRYIFAQMRKQRKNV